MREIEKRIEELERKNPEKKIVIDVYLGKSLYERIHINENNRREFWNKETESWQDQEIPLKEYC